jgi:hypothetical protein
MEKANDPWGASPRVPPTGDYERQCVHFGTFRLGRCCSFLLKANTMAKKAKKRKYSKSSGSDVKSEMHRYKKGKAKTGRGGKGGKVKSRKQAIAIGLSKARKKGKKVPRKKS